MWFTDVASADNPGKEELRLFVQDVRHFLFFVLEDTQNFGFLWQHDPALHDLAIDTVNHDIAQGAGMELDRTIASIGNERLHLLGLQGRPLKFKFQVLNSIADQWKSIHRDFSVRQWLKQLIRAIGAILDSLIEAAGGAGRVIKDFKDALYALV